MRTAISCTVVLTVAVGLTSLAYAQVSQATETDVLTSRTAVSFGLFLSIGTVIAAVFGTWVAVRVQIALLQARFEERTKSMCHTLDRHEQAIEDLQRRRGSE